MRFKRKYVKRYDSQSKKNIKVFGFFINNKSVSRNTFLKELGNSKRNNYLTESKNGNMYYKPISKYEYKEIDILRPQFIHFSEKDNIEFFAKKVGKGKLMVIKKPVEISVLEDRQINDEGIQTLNNEVVDLITRMIIEFKITDLDNLYIRPALTFAAIIQKNVYSVRSEFTYSIDSATPIVNIDKHINLILETIFQKSSLIALGVIVIILFAMETEYYAKPNKLEGREK